MEHHRAVEVLRLVEDVDERREVVAVDRADGDEPEVLEPIVLADAGLRHLAELVIDIGHRLAARHVLREFLRSLTELAVGLREADLVEVRGDSALRLRDRHAVVVEDDEELALERACVVEAFHGHAVHDRRVADDRHHAAAVRVRLVEAFAVERVAARHADGGRDRGACVADREEVVGALARFREARHAVALAQLREERIAAGEQLVRVALVADIEEQAVVREVEDAVHRDRELDHAEVRRKVAARARDLLADRGAHLGRKISQLVHRHGAKRGGRGERRENLVGHGGARKGARSGPRILGVQR